MAEYVNDGSTSYHSISILDHNDAVVVPESIRYRVVSGQGTQKIGWTSVNAETTEIEVSAAANTIGADGIERYLTVEVTHNGGRKIMGEAHYTLVNLQGGSL